MDNAELLVPASEAASAAGPPRDQLRGIDHDCNDIPDAAMTLAVAALFAEGPTAIRNVYNWRVKETERMKAIVTELGKLGAEVGRDMSTSHILLGSMHTQSCASWQRPHLDSAGKLGAEVRFVQMKDQGQAAASHACQAADCCLINLMDVTDVGKVGHPATNTLVLCRLCLEEACAVMPTCSGQADVSDKLG